MQKTVEEEVSGMRFVSDITKFVWHSVCTRRGSLLEGVVRVRG